MKKITLLVVAFVFAMVAQAQTTISFETDEGYELGDINGQNGWTVTQDPDGNPVDSQVVTDEKASDGDNSFKISALPELGGQEAPIVGGFYGYENTVNPVNTTVSFDIYIDGTNDGSGSIYAFQLVSNAAQAYQMMVYFNYDGKILAFTPSSTQEGSLDSNDIGQWEPQTWYSVEVVLTEGTATYYIDDEEVFEGESFATDLIDEARFVHDNYGGEAYIDDFTTDTDMGVEDFTASDFTHYTKNNTLYLTGDSQIGEVAVYNLLGQQVASQTVNATSGELNLSDLTAGVYIAKVASKGQAKSFKFVKK